MSKINQIQAAILSLDPGAYQKLMDSYIMRKYGFSNIMPLGSHSGTNKVTKGTPDAFVQCTDGRFILIAHGSVENHAYGKVQSDILNCLDIKYGLVLNLGGVQTQTYFSCLIDDATRYILHGEFYGTMEQGIVEDTLQKAMLKFGLPRRLYFDNGTQYRTRWMKRACDLLGIRLIYAKPRNPQGKGKQERFNQTMDAFLAEVSLHPPESLQELNTKFQAWLHECYHSKPHSALGTTPEIAFKSDSMPPRFVDKALMARAFLHCESRKADKSGVISFGGKRYDLGIAFAGKQVDVVYDPICTEILTIETPDHEPFQVRQIVVGEKVAPKPKRKEIERIPVDHSRLLDAITEPYQDKQRRRAISYTTEIEKG